MASVAMQVSVCSLIDLSSIQLQTLDQWDAIVSNAKNNGYKRFRIYGNDCGTCGAIFGLGISINISYRNYF